MVTRDHERLRRTGSDAVSIDVRFATQAGHQQDDSTAFRRVVDQLVKKIAEKDALCADLQHKVAVKDALCAHLQQKDAEKDALCAHLQQKEKAVAEAAAMQLRAEVLELQGKCTSVRLEKEQVRDIGLQLGKKLKTTLEENTALRDDLVERTAQLQAAQENYSALLQPCQQMQLSHLAQINAMRQAAAFREQQMEAIKKKAQQKEEEAQERQRQFMALSEEAQEEVQDLKEELAEVTTQYMVLHKWGEGAMANIDRLEVQLDARLRRASQLPVLNLVDCPLVALAGEGAQSSVDLHVMNGKLIAVKKPEFESDKRTLLFEEEALALMDHSAIPKPLAWLAMDDGKHALGIPALTGGSLRDLLGPQQDSGKAGVRLSMVEGMSLIEQGAEALQCVHSSGYVHSDIKPENLMLDAEGRLAIIDWGSAYQIYERPRTWGGSNGYVRPAIAASTEITGPEDDIRGLCAVGLEIATSHCVAELLRRQYDVIYTNDESSSDEEVAKKEEAKESITEFCENHSGLDPLVFMDRMLAAEYLGYISVKEEDFEPCLNEEGAPREYLRLMLCAVSRPVGCNEAPMPTLQEVRAVINSYLAASAGPSSEAGLA
ncbi:g4459 [Coccomyxa elongata]